MSAREMIRTASRAVLRGKPLSKDCYRAHASYREFERDGVSYTGCHGLTDASPGIYNEECKRCGAYVMNIDPLTSGKGAA